ncbi:MAG: ABC transporter ATP-binding protein [Clostridia bacterium]
MAKIFKYLKAKEWALIGVSLIFIVIQVWLDLKLPDYMTEITLLIQTPGSAISEIWAAGGWMLLCALGSLVSSVIVGFFAARIAAKFAQRIREMVFNKVEDFSMEEINKFSTASLITRSTNDITQIQLIVAMGLQAMIKAPILAVWAITKIANKSWQWTTATGVAVGVLLVMITVIIIFVIPRFKKIQSLTDNLNRVTRENLTGLRVVRAYNAENYQEKKFDVANNELTQNNLFANRLMAIIFPGMSLISNGLTLSIYWIGAYLINAAGFADKLLIFSNMIVFTAYAMQVVMAFMILAMIFVMLPRASVSAKRIMEVLDTKPSIIDGDINDVSTEKKGEIEFKNVSFKYPDAADFVLHDVSFKAKQGETIAIIGSTGCGKSTVVNLIPRFYDATDGEVLIDGINVKNYTQEFLHNKIGYVPQRAVLFSGTVTTNVRFGDNGKEAVDEVGLKKAINIAQGTDFVEEMNEGYEASISQGGTNISGGQKQRLAIARAIARKPEMILFDDSFSALDYKTDNILRTELKKELAATTKIIVAQRIGTIKDADCIIVLEKGNIVGLGKHKELLKNCKVYQEIAYSQLSKEELYNV